MPWTNIVRERLDRSVGLARDLIAVLDSKSLNSKLPQLPSNTLGEQMWCVIGARESYARAIRSGEWAGFACSLENPQDQSQVAEALLRSEVAVREALDGLEAFTESQSRFLVDLIEHEAAHQGQCIRYLYGLKLPIPPSWKSRYSLD